MQLTEITNSLPSTEVTNQVKKYVNECLSKNTRINYACDWKSFTKWCDQENFISLPASPETVANFIAFQANDGFSPPTIIHRIAAIKMVHELGGYDSPTTNKLVKSTLSGIKRSSKNIPDKKAPVTVERLEQMVSYCDESLIGLRDKALLMIGFMGALRRSELVELTINDLEYTPEGIKITIRRSKTDQEGKGQIIPILNGSRLRVVDTLIKWLDASNIKEGYIFTSIKKSGKIQTQQLSHKSVVDIVKKYAKKSGFMIDKFSGHSLRAGFLTSAAESGASVFKMMEVSRHKDMQTVVGYVRSAKMFEKHAGENFA